MATEAGRYLALDYLYCDAGNYKALGSIWLGGTLTDAERTELIGCLESDEFFVAEQIGLPPLYSALYEHGGGPNEDDHAWHTFSGFREAAELPQKAEIEFSAPSVLAAFRASKRNWRPELSANFFV